MPKYKYNELVIHQEAGIGNVLTCHDNLCSVSFKDGIYLVPECDLIPLLTFSKIRQTKRDLVIHTPSIDDARVLAEQLEQFEPMHPVDDWCNYGKDTCFTIYHGKIASFGSKDFYENRGEKVYEFSNIHQEEAEVQNNMKFKVGDKVIANENVRGQYNVIYVGWCGIVKEVFENGDMIVAGDGRAFMVKTRFFDPISSAIKKHEFRFAVSEGERYVSEGKHKGKTIPTITTIAYDDSIGASGCATCDKANYDERQGILEAVANMVYGNFQSAYDKCKAKVKKTNDLLCRCQTCGKKFDTPDKARECEKAHIQRKIDKHENYLIRKEAKKRLADAEREGRINEIMKQLYKEEQKNAQKRKA